MLLQIRDYIQREQMVSSQQLLREFDLDESSLQPMLAIWIRRGVISPSENKVICKSGCFSCKTKTPIFYHYNLR